jgi:hypothetical protein
MAAPRFVIIRVHAALALPRGSRQDGANPFFEREVAMRARLLPLFALCLLAMPLASANAGSPQDSTAEAERLANEAIAKMMKALDLLIMTVPRYAAPEILPNGDIIIRRLDPGEEDEEPIETKDDGIET